MITPPPDEGISLKDHFDALRDADRIADRRLQDALLSAAQDLREAVRLGDLALQAERDKSDARLEVSRETALAAALLAVKEKNELALANLSKAAEVLAAQTLSDKKAANEWRGTVNDIISKMGGIKIVWGVIAGLIGLGLLIWNSVRENAKRMDSEHAGPTPVQVTQPANAPVPVKPVP